MIRLKVQEIAERKGIDQENLAQLANVDRNVIQRIYDDPFTDVTVDLLDNLATVLNVDASLLIESISES